MKVGSLFAGIGGFDLAAERAGHEVVWQSEIDKYASKTLAKHWPDIPNLGDIHDITHPPAVDILCGGFPCQDYSVAGNRGGLAGDRGALWWEYLRLIDQERPTWVIGENVPGLFSSRGGADFETIVRSLTECGYGVVWAVLDAQYFGVAQRRRRLFIVGHSGGQPRPEVLALAEGLSGDPEPSREERKDVAPTLTARTRGGGGRGTDFEVDGGLIPKPIAFEDNRRDGIRLQGDTTNTLTARMGEGGNNMPMVFHSSQTPISSSSVAHPLEQNSRASHAVAFAANQRDEVRELEVAGALAAEPGIKQQTYVTQPSVRRLTPLECERLQGFPDGWTEGNSNTQRYRQLGNAVAVPVAQWIMERIGER